MKIYNSIPEEYSSQGTCYGSNRKIYLDFVNELRQRENAIKNVHLALYLFNNAYLYQELLNLAKKGVEIVVTSLPLAGYDKRKITDAKRVYEEVINDGEIGLLIFPHMYLWYGAEYAGGGAAYSFHVKAGTIEYKDETSKAFLTSGNMAPGDPTHSETTIFIEAPNSSSLVQAFKTFFSIIEKRAKPFAEYNKSVVELPSELQQVFDFAFVGSTETTDLSQAHASHAFFTAPSITVGGKGSNHYAREKLVDIALSAKQRLFVCAQHSHDISPFDCYRGQTMIGSIIRAKETNPKIDVRVLKQVASSGLADKRRAAFVEAHLHHARVPQRVNRLVHDKFVVADDIAVISTSNFTATQFGWGRRLMEFKTKSEDLRAIQKVVESADSFFGTPRGVVRAQMTRPRSGSPKVKVLKDDIFSEVNAFLVIEDAKVADQMARYFNDLWSHSLSADVKIPI